MPNVKLREIRIKAGDGFYRIYRATEGLFLEDGNWKYPEGEEPVIDGELMDFNGRPHGKLVPGEVVSISDDHPVLKNADIMRDMLEITTEPATRRIGTPVERKVRKRRGRPPKNVNPNNAEVRSDA